MLALINRNTRLYFRDKGAVLLSLLSVIVIVVLHIVFLGNTYKQELDGVPAADVLVASWMIAGTVTVSSITTTMGALGTMVQDREKGIQRDFLVSPVSRTKIAAAYVLSALIVSFLIGVLLLFISQIYITALGGGWLSFSSLIKSLGILALSSFTGCAMVFFLTTFLKTLTAFSSASAVLGTLIGFITGMYINIGSLPEAIQLVIKIFPISHAAALMRQVFLEDPMSVSFAGAPSGLADEFNLSMGVNYVLGNHQVTQFENILYLVAAGALFFILSSIRLHKKAK